MFCLFIILCFVIDTHAVQYRMSHEANFIGVEDETRELVQVLVQKETSERERRGGRCLVHVLTAVGQTIAGASLFHLFKTTRAVTCRSPGATKDLEDGVGSRARRTVISSATCSLRVSASSSEQPKGQGPEEEKNVLATQACCTGVQASVQLARRGLTAACRWKIRSRPERKMLGRAGGRPSSVRLQATLPVSSSPNLRASNARRSP